MKFSNLLCPTIREVPNDAELMSHKLMIRAGLIRKVAAGIYTYLPLGLKIIRKFENIVREEMNNAGAQEVLMPSIIPSELWEESGRWDMYGKELLRVTDRHDNNFCYGPTHEEVITDLVRNNIKSYKQIPVNLYQIQTKFRDEIRPRFGLMRGREFGMKDAYSFHETKECLDKTYEDMRQAYKNIFSRCDLDVEVVEADSGNIGGDSSSEFMIIADSGEDDIAVCSKTGRAANTEAAPFPKLNNTPPTNNIPEKELVDTPHKKTIEEVSAMLECKSEDCVKSLICVADEKPVMVLIRGDRELNQPKCQKVLNADHFEIASDEQVKSLTGLPVGFVGPVELSDENMKNIKVIGDYSIQSMSEMVMGANQADKHFKNVKLGRDFEPDEIADVSLVKDGDPSGFNDDGIYNIKKGIEVGHIFKLGNKYSTAMKAQFLDSSGKQNVYEMGCYGIGIGRTVAAVIEQYHDEKGIIWPIELAPFQIDLILTNTRDEELVKTAQGLYESIKKEGYEIIFDDRKESAGVKFKDAELIGFPIQIVLGKSFQERQMIEVKIRKTDEKIEVEKDSLSALLKEKLITS